MVMPDRAFRLTAREGRIHAWGLPCSSAVESLGKGQCRIRTGFPRNGMMTIRTLYRPVAGGPGGCRRRQDHGVPWRGPSRAAPLSNRAEQFFTHEYRTVTT
ncbi:hypothetical protein GCM10010446_11930 [Streptomyces enissocaesilis]|uniref:Uncharacterized protein n=1 Tax=Streptomyces enissocaesilis TaxID=332589 RepID=A0ABN3WV64_9ACTN